jgi:hypothetical protein
MRAAAAGRSLGRLACSGKERRWGHGETGTGEATRVLRTADLDGGPGREGSMWGKGCPPLNRTWRHSRIKFLHSDSDSLLLVRWAQVPKRPRPTAVLGLLYFFY